MAQTRSTDIDIYFGTSLARDVAPAEFRRLCVVSEGITPEFEYFTPNDECSGGSRSQIQGGLVSEKAGGSIAFTLAPSNWLTSMLSAALFDAAPTLKATAAVGDIAQINAGSASSSEYVSYIEFTNPADALNYAANELIILHDTTADVIAPAVVTKSTNAFMFASLDSAEYPSFSANEATTTIVRPNYYTLANDEIYTWVLKDLTNLTEGVTYSNLQVSSIEFSGALKQGIDVSVTYQSGTRTLNDDTLASTAQTIVDTVEGATLVPAVDEATLLISDRVSDAAADGTGLGFAADPDTNGVMRPLGGCVQSWSVAVNNQLTDIECLFDTAPSGAFAGKAEVTFTFEVLISQASYDKLYKQQAERVPIGAAFTVANYSSAANNTGIGGLGFVIPNGYLSVGDAPKAAGELVSVTATISGTKKGDKEAIQIYVIPTLRA